MNPLSLWLYNANLCLVVKTFPTSTCTHPVWRFSILPFFDTLAQLATLGCIIPTTIENKKEFKQSFLMSEIYNPEACNKVLGDIIWTISSLG